jgi:hypothetical protein
MSFQFSHQSSEDALRAPNHYGLRASSPPSTCTVSNRTNYILLTAGPQAIPANALLDEIISRFINIIIIIAIIKTNTNSTIIMNKFEDQSTYSPVLEIQRCFHRQLVYYQTILSTAIHHRHRLTSAFSTRQLLAINLPSPYDLQISWYLKNKNFVAHQQLYSLKVNKSLLVIVIFSNKYQAWSKSWHSATGEAGCTCRFLLSFILQTLYKA